MRNIKIIISISFLFFFNISAWSQLFKYSLKDDNGTAEEVLSLEPLGPLARPADLLVNGLHYYNRDSTFSIGSVGLWTFLPEYNFVDGFWIGHTFDSKYIFNSETSLEAEAKLYYSTAREKFIWQTEFIYNYLPYNVGRLKLRAGRLSTNYDTEDHIDRLENSLYTLILGLNNIRFYEKHHVTLENSTYTFTGFRLFQSLNLERRSMLKNNTTFSFLNLGRESNLPNNVKFRPMPHSLAMTGSLGFDYTFFMDREEKLKLKSREIIYSDFPTISFKYVFGIPVGTINRSKFNYMEAYVNQRFRFESNSTLDYKIGGGGFLGQENLYFPDFKHFGSYSLPTIHTFTEDGYFLLDNYSADTNDHWVRASVNYLSPKLLLTQIDWLRRNDFTEGLHFRYLHTPRVRHHSEWAYVIGYKNWARAGLTVALRGARYHNIGFTFSLPLLSSYY